MKSKSYECWCEKWILMTFNNSKKTKQTLRGQKKSTQPTFWKLWFAASKHIYACPHQRLFFF